jgi:hypothetical protein
MRVAIVGRGFSELNFWESADKYWGITRSVFKPQFKLDMCWWMDDLRWMRDHGFACTIDQLKDINVPLMTSIAYPEFKTAIEFPIDKVVEIFNRHHPHMKMWFNNTVAYAVAYAILTKGIDELHFHGVDYCRQDQPEVAASERACTTMWMGRAEAFGIKVKVNKVSMLLDDCYEQGLRDYPTKRDGLSTGPFYGYPTTHPRGAIGNVRLQTETA